MGGGSCTLWWRAAHCGGELHTAVESCTLWWRAAHCGGELTSLTWRAAGEASWEVESSHLPGFTVTCLVHCNRLLTREFSSNPTNVDVVVMMMFSSNKRNTVN